MECSEGKGKFSPHFQLSTELQVCFILSVLLFMLSISSVAGDVHGVRSSVGESLKEGEGLSYLVFVFFVSVSSCNTGLC